MDASSTESEKSSSSSSDNFDVWSDERDIIDSDIEDESCSSVLAFEPVGSSSNNKI